MDYLEKAKTTLGRDMSVKDVLAQVETQYGKWWSYGGDGRQCLHSEAAGCYGDDAGLGWKARMKNNVHGGDYGWTFTTTSSEAMAIIELLASELAIWIENNE